MADEPRRAPLRARHLVPLVGFVVPSLVIGYGFVLPRHHVPLTHELSIGFATTIIGAVATYVVGVVAALRR